MSLFDELNNSILKNKNLLTETLYTNNKPDELNSHVIFSSKKEPSNDKIYEAQLTVFNPYIINDNILYYSLFETISEEQISELKRKGYDCIIYENNGIKKYCSLYPDTIRWKAQNNKDKIIESNIINDKNYNTLLFESKIDYILNNDKAINIIANRYYYEKTNGDNLPKDTPKEEKLKLATEALKRLEELPYTNKYMIWMVKQYIKHEYNIRIDLNKINSLLEQFSKISHKLEKKNINDYSWNEFLELSDKFDEMLTSNEEKRLAKAGAEKLFEDENWLVIHPKTEEAACYYGKGTRWCTAAREDNEFDNYNRDGDLYIIISKINPEEKYQFHFESGSFMNAEDDYINDAEKKRILSDDGLQKFLLKLSKKYNNAVDDKLLNYNGEPFIIPFDTLYIVYSDKHNDSMLFDEVKYTLIDKPDYLVNNIDGEWDIILDKEDEEIILNAYKKLGIKYPEDLTKRMLSEIERSFSSTQRSFSSNFDNLAQKIIDDTNLDQICEDIWIESTYKEMVQDIFYQINKQVPFNVEEYKKDTIKISAINEKQSNEIKNIILQYQIFNGEIDPDYYYYDNRQEFSDVYEYIVYTLMEGDKFSIFEPQYGWSGFDRKALTKYISDTVYDYIINNVSAEEINVINKDISDYFEEK